MKKIITLFLVAFALTASAQKDTATVDTLYILGKQDIQFVQKVLRQNTIHVDGRTLTFDDVLQLIQTFEGKVYYLPKKEQPKK